MGTSMFSNFCCKLRHAAFQYSNALYVTTGVASRKLIRPTIFPNAGPAKASSPRYDEMLNSMMLPNAKPASPS